MATKANTPQTPVAPPSPGIHTNAKDAPVKQTDANGVAVVKVADRYFKMVDEVLMVAFIPSDFSIPEVWDELPADDFNRASALSLLGVA